MFWNLEFFFCNFPAVSLILNIETATPICSVCIGKDGKELVTREIREGQAHAESLTLLIQEALDVSGLKMNQLDAIAASNGPGSYTGLRIGLSVAKGICYALDKKLITLDSLEVLAWGTFQKTGRSDVLYCPMIDARRMGGLYCPVRLWGRTIHDFGNAG